MIEIGVDFEPDSIAVTGTFVRLFHEVYRSLASFSHSLNSINLVPQTGL